MNYFDSDMYNSTNTVVYFDTKHVNLYLCLRAISLTIYAAKFEQTITLNMCFYAGKFSHIDGAIVLAHFKCTSYIYKYWLC
jgi:hypothetical protein